MNLNASRLSGFLVVLVAVFSLSNAFALDNNDGAKKFIEKVSNDALSSITSNASEKDKEAQLTKLFINSVDTKWIATFAMGKYWREATDSQKTEYVEIHKKFLLNNYIPKFRQYNNQEIKIIKAYVSEKNPNESTVESKIISKDGAAINVDYKVRKTGNKYMIYDVVAEGVSLIATQRSDFASILSRSGIDELIKMLGKRV